MKSNTLEVAFDLNDLNLHFRPLGANVRGRKDYARMARHNHEFMALAAEFPRGVPSTILRIDLANKAVVLVEPLRLDEWTPEREKIEERGIRIPHDIVIQHPHLPDWLWEVQRAVDHGYAQIVEGELPKDLGVETPAAPREEDEPKEDVKALVGVVKELVESLKAALAK